ncbi:MAG TPA: acyl carrier protein [Paracoccus sp.]|nr:acyl carrier protein [Paracoccus sp. (in: a-proteobacteria)]
MSNIETRARQIVCATLGVDPDRVTHDAALIADLGADSLDIVEICMALEEAFGNRIDAWLPEQMQWPAQEGGE